ncbi:hypothetical protein FHS07_001800 [Microbacterium proteolyticum]|uniref:HNH endonuclease n=1 Tax=Microbacterium proteolyticum TaxID=1572644 RepID=A0A7W5CJP1_9MICO|nr:HNH endonuclease [Microbacterium proteolyticum]MBB3158104.1 hypothetical protein [Microbacterium proteolyticum]
MISQPVELSTEDVLATQAVSERSLTPDPWADERIGAMKARAKKHYIAEQDNRCCYCAEQWLTEHGRVWDLEHVVPKVLRPEFMFEPRNLAVACPDCNLAKWDKETLTGPQIAEYPSQAGSFLVVHPHFDRWEDHIEKCGVVFRPITEKGTWTVTECNLGRFALKYADPTDEADPLDRRFEAALTDLTADPVTAQAALVRIQTYLASGAGAVPL